MNNKIQLSRLKSLFFLEYQVNKKKLWLSIPATISILLATGLLIVWGLGIEQLDHVNILTSIFFYLIWGLGVLILTIRSFKMFSKTTTAIPYLATPVSHLERFIVIITKSFISWSVLTFLIFAIFSPIFYSITKQLFEIEYHGVNDVYYWFKNVTAISVVYIFSMHIKFLLGSVFFKRHAFLKTILCYHVLTSLSFFVILTIVQGAYGDAETMTTMVSNFYAERIFHLDVRQFPEFIKANMNYIMMAMACTNAILYYPIYLKIKEKEVY
ncbi:MAG: hypothetical protein N4A37_04275 [Prolixibacteraceae bacterium]|jgi:hypothetical protein|nr:hypothetical protein [Prolixibacteraceae bacterium]